MSQYDKSDNVENIPPQIELIVSCTDLLKRDKLSKSDPVCILWVKKEDAWEEFERTEEIKNNHNPRWETHFVLDYKFEERQLLKFEVIDVDEKKNDPLGQVECSLGELVAHQRDGFSKELVNQDRSPAGTGKLQVQAEERAIEGAKETVVLTFQGDMLDNLDLFGKSDPFMEINRVDENGGFSKVCTTETIDNNLNPAWKPITIEVDKLCNRKLDRSLRFDIFDEDYGGVNDTIGSFRTTYRTLTKGPGKLNTYDLINEEKQRKDAKYTNSGKVRLTAIKRTKQPDFLDFLSDGLQLNFTVAVDFTASNGLPHNPLSLHYRGKDGKERNMYEAAIRSIGEIIQDYDADKQYDALGFGAKVPPSIEVSHLFNLKEVMKLEPGADLDQDGPGQDVEPESIPEVGQENEQQLDANHEQCQGVEGVLEAYKKCLDVVQLNGPTHFTPVIKHMTRQAEKYKSKPTVYSILLIITDGIITDMEETKEAIIDASDLPLSIIIVGVGDEDFSQMDQLDGDKRKLSVLGKEGKRKETTRDIVQFVKMNPVEGEAGEVSAGKEELSEKVLKEIPGQVEKWMCMQDFAEPVVL